MLGAYALLAGRGARPTLLQQGLWRLGMSQAEDFLEHVGRGALARPPSISLRLAGC